MFVFDALENDVHRCEVMASLRRIVVTGVGLQNPIGSDPSQFWQALLEQRSGIGPIRSFDTSALSFHFAGEIADFNPKVHLEKKQRKSLKMMSRTIQLAVVAAKLALVDGRVPLFGEGDQAGKIDPNAFDPTRFGVNFGGGLMATELPELADAAHLSVDKTSNHVDLEKWGSEGLENIQPKFMLKYLPNMHACHVSMLHDLQGPNNTITESDVASTLALGEALRILQRNDADYFLVGGADSKMNPLSTVRVSLFEELSTRNDAPEKACRPFEKNRDGVVLGEGATVLLLEELEHAKERGATIYAEVVGFGASFDTKRDGSGYTRSIRAALGEAGISATDLDHINAQGLSTQAADRWEAKGIHAALGGEVPVFAGKSYFGNLSAGAGVTELACSVLALHHGMTPTTLNYDEPDPECPVTVLSGEPRPLQHDYVVKTSATQMGQCAAVVLKRWA